MLLFSVSFQLCQIVSCESLLLQSQSQHHSINHHYYYNKQLGIHFTPDTCIKISISNEDGKKLTCYINVTTETLSKFLKNV